MCSALLSYLSKEKRENLNELKTIAANLKVKVNRWENFFTVTTLL